MHGWAIGGACLLASGCSDDGRGATGSASASADDTTGVATTPPDTSGTLDTGPDGTAGATSQGTMTSVADSSTGDPKFDVATGTDVGTGGCTCGTDLSFSYIWIANSNESTVSKINTDTLVEEARYRTHPASGSPSRTSVSVDGRGVAVANRNGGLTKVSTLVEDCDADYNGMPGLQTSAGPMDVRAWGDDDCVAWHVPFNYSSQRPVAFTPGVQNRETCAYEEQKVWTAGCTAGMHVSVQVHLLDGETGVVEQTVDVTAMPCFGAFAAYGGAVDSAGDFWFTSNEPTTDLAVVRLGDLSFESWPAPTWGYGIAIDALDRPWVTANTAEGASNIAAMRFDPVAQSWAVVDNIKIKGYAGIQEGADGLMYLNYNSYDNVQEHGIAWIDRDALMVVDHLTVPGITDRLNGVSIDLQGRVWSVAPGQNTAFRYDPISGDLDSVGGLNYPYTYSDMTGWGIQTSACGPPG